MGGVLYGAECYYITQARTQKMRRVLCAAMGDSHHRRPDGIRLLVEERGKWEQEVVRAKCMVKHKQKEYKGYAVPQAYWEAPKGTAGKQGPVSRMRHFLEQYGVECPAPGLWVVQGKECPVDGATNLGQRVAEQVRDALWGQQAKRRPHLCGLEHGRDEDKHGDIVCWLPESGRCCHARDSRFGQHAHPC